MNCPSKTRTISKFSKITRVIYPKNPPNQTGGYWLITPNQHFVFKLILFNSRQLQISERATTKQRQLQNNSVNNTMLMTINRVIIYE